MAFKFTELDTGSTLEVTCKDDATGVVIDLTGFTQILLRYKIDTSAVQEKAMTITNAVGGVAEYKFLAAELLAGGGNFTGEVRITDGAGFIVTSVNNIVLDVKDRVAA